MLRPSYSELMNLLNEANDVDNEITSRYTIVMAVAKRARQIIDGSQVLSKADTDKAVSIAVAEMSEGKLEVKSAPLEDLRANERYSLNIIETDNLDDNY